jgi:hypothetical protein
MAVLVLAVDLSANAESQEGGAKRSKGRRRRAFFIARIPLIVTGLAEKLSLKY